jgi:hypothetical protein
MDCGGALTQRVVDCGVHPYAAVVIAAHALAGTAVQQSVGGVVANRAAARRRRVVRGRRPCRAEHDLRLDVGVVALRSELHRRPRLLLQLRLAHQVGYVVA